MWQPSQNHGKNIYPPTTLYIISFFIFFSRSLFRLLWSLGRQSKAKESQHECEIGCRSYLGVRTGCVYGWRVFIWGHTQAKTVIQVHKVSAEKRQSEERKQKICYYYMNEKNADEKGAEKYICAKSESRRAGVCVRQARVWEMRQQFLWRFFFFPRIYATSSFFSHCMREYDCDGTLAQEFVRASLPIVFSYLSITCVRAMAT